MQVSAGSILSRSLQVVFANLALFVPLAALLRLPTLLLGIFASPAPGEMPWLSMLSDTLFGSLLQGAVLVGVVQALRGQRADLGKCMQVALSRLFPIIVVGFLSGLGVAFGMILLIVPGVMLMCAWYVAVPATVIERTGIGASFSRSNGLTKDHRMTIFVVLLPFLAIGAVLAFALMPLLAKGETTLAALIGYGVALTIGLWGSAAAAVVYHDLRAAKEGLDSEALGQVFD